MQRVRPLDTECPLLHPLHSFSNPYIELPTIESTQPSAISINPFPHQPILDDDSLCTPIIDCRIHVLTSGIGDSLVSARIDPAAPANATSTAPDLPDSNFLRVPINDKMFLISPPGSPPTNWNSTFEDPPVSASLRFMNFWDENENGDNKGNQIKKIGSPLTSLTSRPLPSFIIHDTEGNCQYLSSIVHPSAIIPHPPST